MIATGKPPHHSRRHDHRRNALVVAAMLAALPAAPSLSASSFTWSGTHSNTWNSTTLNWAGGTTTWSNGANTAAFDTTASSGTVTLGIPVQLRILLISGGDNWVLSGSGANSFSASGLSGTPLSIDVNAAVSATISAAIADGAGNNGLTISGSNAGGTAVLAGVNTFTGTTTITQGVLALGGNAAINTDGVLGHSAGNVILNATGGLSNATLAAASGENATVSRGISLGGGGGVVSGGTLAALSAGNTLEIDGAISAAGTNNALNIGGAGIVLLTNSANSYAGGTTVNNATLLVGNGASGSATGAGTVTLNNATFGGFGTAAGTIMPGTGSNTVFPSATLSATSATTLTVGGLTTGSATTLRFNLVTSGNALNGTVSSSDRIVISGSGGLVLNGGTVNLTNHATGAASLGFYKVIGYSGAIGGTGLSSLSLPASANNVVYTFDTTHDSNFIDIHRGFRGDVDDSGFVDINDLATLAANWQLAGGWAQGNFLGDSVVDINDLAVLAANWQTGIASFGEAADSLGDTSESFQQAVWGMAFGKVSQIPEPLSLALLGPGLIMLTSRRHKRLCGRELQN